MPRTRKKIRGIPIDSSIIIEPQIDPDIIPIVEYPLPSFTTAYLRPQDLLYLRFQLVNLQLDQSDQGTNLVRVFPNKPAHLVVYFQPQNIAEEAFFETSPAAEKQANANLGQPAEVNSVEPPPDPPVNMRMAGDSRLVFKIPDAVLSLPYSLKTLMDWNAYEPALAPTALPPLNFARQLVRRPRIAAPKPLETAIELPYRLIISPNLTARWVHAADLVTHAGRTELWHTRLATLVNGSITEAPAKTRTFRAIWSPDYRPNNPPSKSETGAFHRPTLTPNDRYQLVRLTSDFYIRRFAPQPVNAEKLMLSTMGAWLTSQGNWDPPAAAGLDIEEWRHIATMGRDQYVRVVYRGFLYPFGHRASLVKISERKVQANVNGKVAAYVRQRMFIIVREPEKTYLDAAYAYHARENPFAQNIHILTRMTPNIEDPAASAIDGNLDVFWVRVEGQDHHFHLQALDVDGRLVDFGAAMIFISQTQVDQIGLMNDVRAQYAAANDRRSISMNGQPVSFAVKNGTDEASLTTQTLFLTSQALAGTAPGVLSFLPTLDQAAVRVPAVESLTGSQKKDTTIQLFQKYLDHGFDPAFNKAEAFAAMVGGTLGLQMPVDVSGGISNPNLGISGLSRHLGPLAGNLDNLAGGTFDPLDFFPDDAMLMGAVKLKDIIQGIFDDSQFPRMLQQRFPDYIEASLELDPQVQSTLIFVKHDDTKFTIKAFMRKYLKPNPPDDEFRVTGDLTKFDINFLDVIVVRFDSLNFKAEKGKKLDVSAQVAGVDFQNELSFVNTLKDVIPADGFKDPPFLDITTAGVTVGYTLGLPPLAIGVFSLKNVSLGASLMLPFTGESARLRFNFCERQRPFQLTVSLFGGGGFFAMALGLDKIEIIEAALEFGAAISIDLGVASGSVSVMAGIYFKLEDPNKCTLTGYLRMNGDLDVLGIISISVEFYLSFTYVSDTGKVEGQATLTVKVEVLFFSASVSMTVKRQFRGSNNDPSFGQLVEPADWVAYGAAFALD